MSLVKRIKSVLSEVQWPKAQPSAQRPRFFHADYYAITKSGTRSRFNRTTGLSNIMGAASETAVRSYLLRLHPACDIQIQTISFS